MGIFLSKVVLFLSHFKYQTTSSPTHTEDLQLKDQISELPDDIFGIILSRLPIKEVARSSVISRRWRNLWKLTARLDLDNFEETNQCDLSEADLVNYVKCINKIVESHEVGKLEEFRIRYRLDKRYDSDINKWFKFAFSKQVQIFYFELPSSNYSAYASQRCSLSTELVETFVNHKFNGFKYLKALTLNGVKLNDEVVEFIMNNSPVLEQLCIKAFASLSTFQVCGPQCVLKSLEVEGNLKTFEISDVPTLVSLRYSGCIPPKLKIKNVPSLTDLHFSGSMVGALFELKLNDLLSQFSSSLKTLTLNMSCVTAFENYRSLPKMTALEKLVLCTGYGYRSSSWYAYLAEMCPSLREFVFQARMHSVDIALPDGTVEELTQDPLQHECLKEVKILGYYGLTRDDEIVSYFIKSAPALETIVIDPRDQSYLFHRSPPDTKIEREARLRAKQQLKWKIPSRVNLVLL